jgi:hypothetical protein
VLKSFQAALQTMIRDFISGMSGCILKHPDYTVRWCSKGSNSGKMDCVVQYPNYTIDCVQGFQHRKDGLCCAIP